MQQDYKKLQEESELKIKNIYEETKAKLEQTRRL